MKLKRTTPEQMFTIVRDFCIARPGPFTGESLPQRFFVVPRYKALLRADPRAIRNFFSFMSLGGSPRAALIKPILQAACHSRLALRLAMRAGHVHSVHESSAYPGVRWDIVDALVAQWQFVGCFSLSERIVAHCLIHPMYRHCLYNEVEARREVAGVVPVPELQAVHLDWPSGWVEGIVRGTRRVRDEDSFFAQAQKGMLQVYHQTRQDVRLSDYLDRLGTLARERYAEEAEPRRRIEALLERVREQARSEDSDAIWLSRCHGDLNRGQVIVERGKAHLIDWSESERSSVFHDFVYSALFRYGWRDFERPVAVSALEPLRQGLEEVLRDHAPALMVGVVLAEVGVKQHVDFNRGKGMLNTWSRVVDRYLEKTGTTVARSVSAPAKVD